MHRRLSLQVTNPSIYYRQKTPRFPLLSTPSGHGQVIVSRDIFEISGFDSYTESTRAASPLSGETRQPDSSSGCAPIRTSTVSSSRDVSNSSTSFDRYACRTIPAKGPSGSESARIRPHYSEHAIGHLVWWHSSLSMHAIPLLKNTDVMPDCQKAHQRDRVINLRTPQIDSCVNRLTRSPDYIYRTAVAPWVPDVQALILIPETKAPESPEKRDGGTGGSADCAISNLGGQTRWNEGPLQPSARASRNANRQRGLWRPHGQRV